MQTPVASKRLAPAKPAISPLDWPLAYRVRMPAEHFQALADRGFIHQSNDVDGLRQALSMGALTFYVGFDPSAPSLTAGHLVPLMLASHLQRAGHPAILVAGGGTGLIGDPTGKTETRNLLNDDEVATNVRAVTDQLGRFVDLSEGHGQIVNNADWLRGLGYLDFLRTIGRHFSVNEMLATGHIVPA